VLDRKVIYHEHDSPAPGKTTSWFMRVVLAARKSVARTAEFNILPQHERIRFFGAETRTKRPVYCVWNCPAKGDAAGRAGARLRRPDEPLALYFHGAINLDRVPLALIEGAKLCGFPVRIRIVGYETIGSRGASERLHSAAAVAGANVILELSGSVPLRKDLHRLMEGMHVGWISFINRSDDLNLRHLVGASNKAFDYLAAGLPIIVPDTTEWKASYVEPGYARACDAADPEAIASTLRWFHANTHAAAEMGRKGQQRIVAEWNYETQFSKILKVLNGKAESCATIAVS
jgi:glycosyltransferase involved in cell wall biosynthesis